MWMRTPLDTRALRGRRPEHMIGES